MADKKKAPEKRDGEKSLGERRRSILCNPHSGDGSETMDRKGVQMNTAGFGKVAADRDWWCSKEAKWDEVTATPCPPQSFK